MNGRKSHPLLHRVRRLIRAQKAAPASDMDLPDYEDQYGQLLLEPQLDVDGSPRGPYEEVTWPEQFWLQDDSGAIDGPFFATSMQRDEESGAYVHAPGDGSRALVLRVTLARDDDPVIYTVDGFGRPWRYKILTDPADIFEHDRANRP